MAKVLVLYTGGTFGMQPQASTRNPLVSPLSNVPAEVLIEALGEAGRAEGIDWELEQPGPPIDSSAVTPRHWLALAQSIHSRYQEFDGFVVIHGTDTLAYTASALSFLLKNLSKPVVLTGSQLPIFAPRSDARQNFLNALWIAGYAAVGLPRICEVVVAFGEKLLRGNRCRKASTSGWQGFFSPNFPPLGDLGETPRIHLEHLRDAPHFNRPFEVASGLDEAVLDLTLFPGILASQVESLLSNSGLKGVVLRAYGSGNAPNDPALLDCLRRATDSGKTIVIVSQCPEGIVDLGRYVASHSLLECGVASGFDLTPEAALTKLMWLLSERGDVRSAFQQDHRGEQSFLQREEKFTGKVLNVAAPRIQPNRLERALLRMDGEARGAAQLRLEICEADPEHLENDPVTLTCPWPPGCGHVVLDLSSEVRHLLPGERPWRFRVEFEGSLRQAELVLVERR